MTKTQTLELKLGEARRKLAEAIATADPDMEVVEALTAEIRQTDDLLTAAKLVEPEPVETRETAAGETAEQRELIELRGRVELGDYVKASMAEPVFSPVLLLNTTNTWAWNLTISRWTFWIRGLKPAQPATATPRGIKVPGLTVFSMKRRLSD